MIDESWRAARLGLANSNGRTSRAARGPARAVGVPRRAQAGGVGGVQNVCQSGCDAWAGEPAAASAGAVPR
ncbi:hypothetical protein, partial [Burkholderia glumae]|uniref:hypothetical protein n=1 Tax=Burkholderia glumae TaxID=337 RepID=UPI001E4748A6